MAVADDVRARPVTDRVPPHNLEAEESVLGSMMLSPEAIASVIETLKAPDFYRPVHQKIFQAILAMYARGEPVDAITTVEELTRRGELEATGGALYIYNLVESVPTPGSAAYYAKIVSDHALLRRLIDAASQIMSRAYSIPEDPRRAADEAEGLVYAVARADEKEELVPVRTLVDESMLQLEHIHQRESAFAGIPTGFIDLDNLLSGLQPGNLIVVAARPGVGKSSFVTNLARNVGVGEGTHDGKGSPVLMFSLEMSRWEIGMRLLCGEARVPWDKVRAGRLQTEEWTRVVEAAENLHDAPMFIVDSGNVTIVDIRAKARRLKSSRHGLGLIIVDYLQLMSGHRRYDNRQQEIAEISRSLKLLGKELEVPVIAVSQLNRNPESRADKRPQLSDLRECVTGDTLVTLADGRRVPIERLVGTKPKVLALGPDGRVVRARADKVWRVGEREVFRVRLASGREIKATGRHRLLGATGWARVEDLRVGDPLALARRTPEPATTIEWPDARVALLGQLIGDGSYLTNAPLTYTTASEDNTAAVAQAVVEEFGCRVKRHPGRGNWHQLVIAGNGNRWHPTGVNLWLRELGIWNQRSREKRIPEQAFRLRNRQIALLLRHLWATDGCIHVRPEGQRGSSRVYFASCSRLLVEDVAALLSRLGIVARMREVRHATARSWYTVDVSGTESQLEFLRQVGAFGPRVEPAARLAVRLETVRPNPNVDTLPRELFDRVRASMAGRGITTREMAEMRGTAYGGEAHFSFAPTRTLVREYAELLDDDVLRSRSGGTLFWDKIVIIEPCGTQAVFDLTVPGPASWLLDSVISHNSGAIEQDSDIVMFIHRDDSDTDPAQKGRADLIVAKHRNGPTETIPLTFLPHLTLFRNFARG